MKSERREGRKRRGATETGEMEEGEGGCGEREKEGEKERRLFSSI